MPLKRTAGIGAQPSSPWCSPSSPDQAAISAPDAREEAGVAAVLRRAEIDINRLAGFESALRPARAEQLTGCTPFDFPLHLAAVSVVDRQEDPHVRVHPLPLRDRAREHHDLVAVERRVAVVR